MSNRICNFQSNKRMVVNQQIRENIKKTKPYSQAGFTPRYDDTATGSPKPRVLKEVGVQFSPHTARSLEAN
jgi:hypothetical protein